MPHLFGHENDVWWAIGALAAIYGLMLVLMLHDRPRKP
jgi:hypothetical protein